MNDGITNDVYREIDDPRADDGAAPAKAGENRRRSSAKRKPSKSITSTMATVGELRRMLDSTMTIPGEIADRMEKKLDDCGVGYLMDGDRIVAVALPPAAFDSVARAMRER